MSDLLEAPVSDADIDLPLGLPGVAEYHPKSIPGWHFIVGLNCFTSPKGWTVREHQRSDLWRCSTIVTCPQGKTWSYPCGWVVGRDLLRLCFWVEEHGWPEGWFDR